MSAQEWLRVAIILAIMFSIVGWAVSAHLNWPSWHDTPRAKVVTLAILPILMTNGYAVAKAATEGRPITEVTVTLAVCYVILNVALWVPLPHDPDTSLRRVARR